MAEQHDFHFFISYTKADEAWAEWIAWQLEDVANPPYRVILQAWDFHAGGNFVHEMQKATSQASRTIAILSPEFLQAEFTEAEWQAAFVRDPNGELGLLVPVRVAECKPEGLLKARIYIDLVGLDKDRATTKLLDSISSKCRKPTSAPQFPTTSKIRSEPSFPGPGAGSGAIPGLVNDGPEVSERGHEKATSWVLSLLSVLPLQWIFCLLLIASAIGLGVKGCSAGEVNNVSLLGMHAGQVREFSDLNIEMIWCPPGTFTMGSPEDDADALEYEKPQVDVVLSHGFWLGKTEVTQGQWKQLMGTTPWKGKEDVKEGANYPAVYVSHGLLENGTLDPDSVMAFCQKLTAAERAAGRLPDGWEYTLPTEAQWEYACRAGTSTRYSFGDDEHLLGEYAWYHEDALDIGNRYAHPVGTKRANPWGFHDMHGNVWEWCLDGYNDRLPGGRDPLVESGSDRVARGGSWYNSVWFARSAFRGSGYPSGRSSYLGFRLALSPLVQ